MSNSNQVVHINTEKENKIVTFPKLLQALYYWRLI